MVNMILRNTCQLNIVFKDILFMYNYSSLCKLISQYHNLIIVTYYIDQSDTCGMPVWGLMSI